ncbi:MAG: peptidoglycan-binding domain-containing protein [Candidatus Falkowbacteria bacterium]|nr:peptidoglycan-binding domain-containing protein [Candidatus Falkowbacteria bacterium]
MKKKIIASFLTLCLFSILVPIGKALATSANLSLSGTGDGDSVQLSVAGAPNSSVLFSYAKGGVYQTNSLGFTNSSGSFVTTLSTAAYGISPNSLVHVNVGGLSGTQSPDVAWPYSSAGTLALDKTSIVLPVGQSTVINAQNNGSSLIYLASNSNPIVATVNLTGNQITVIANNYGSTVINVCSQANTTSCASAYINVQNASSKPLAFSQGNVGLGNGQTLMLNIYGGTGTYLLTNNSNSNSIAASINGSNVNLTANSSSGSSAISICSSDLTACGIINATIGTATAPSLSFSQPSPTMSLGQNLVLPITGSTGSYSIFSNSSSNIVNASISGSSLNLNALASGGSTIVVCSSAGTCGSLTATVIGSNSVSGSLALSQNNLWLSVGQNFSLTVSGGTAPYSVIQDANNIASTSINGSIITVTGVNPGSASIGICSAAGACVNLALLVNGTSAVSNAAISLNDNQLSLVYPGVDGVVNILGNGSYFVSSNSNSVISLASISGSQVRIIPISPGTNNISVCQNGGQCANLAVTVNAAPAISPAAVSTSSPTSTLSIPNNTLARSPEGKIYFISGNTREYINSMTELKAKYGSQKFVNVSAAAINVIPDKVIASATAFKFSGSISYGDKGQAVLELQKRLKSAKLYAGALDSKYSLPLVEAVRKYQKNNAIKQTGNIGPMTAAMLNK